MIQIRSYSDWRGVTGITSNTKCKRLRDAFSWIKANVSSTSINTTIVIETNTEEGVCGSGTFMLSGTKGQVDIWDAGIYDQTYVLTRNQ